MAPGAAKVAECRNSEIAATRSDKRLPSPAIYTSRGGPLSATSGRSAGPSISVSLKPQTDDQPRALPEYRLGGGEAGDAHEKPEHHHPKKAGGFFHYGAKSRVVQ